jgi:hypothetical protein
MARRLLRDVCAVNCGHGYSLSGAAREVFDKRRIKGRDFLRHRGKSDEFYERQNTVI